MADDGNAAQEYFMDYILQLVPQRTRKGAEGVCPAKSIRPRPAQEALLFFSSH